MVRLTRILAVARRLGVVCIVFASSHAAAQETAGERLAATEAQINDWEGRMAVLRSEYLRVESLVRDNDLTRAIADGRVRYILGDYLAAATILEPAVENPALRQQSAYPQAVYFLADSYFQSRNFLRAQRYFRQLLASNTREYRTEAASRLIDVASILDDYEGLDELYAELERTGDPAFAYQRGKALYFQGRYGDAITAFRSIAPDTARVGTRAQYFAGASYARIGEFEQALTTFEALTADTELEPDLLALSHLAIGRVLYELGRYDDAITAYSAVPRDSERIDDALYEIAWTFIQLERYPQAVHQLEVMRLLADPEGRSFPESQLLLGDVRMRMENYEGAVDIFETVSSRYLPVEQELDAFARRARSSDNFFDDLINPEDGTLRLPDLASAWFTSDEALERVIGASQDVEMMRASIAESRQLIAELEAALQPGASVDIFPGLRDGWGQAIELENQSLRGWITLLDLEGEMIGARLSGADASRYAQRRDERIALQGRFDAMPRSFAELDERESSVIAEMSALSVEAFRQRMEIVGAMEQLEAMRRILRTQVRNGERSTSSADREDARIDQLMRELRQRELAVDALLNRINVTQVDVSVADGVARSERETRRRLVAALVAEAEALAPARQGANGPWARMDEAYRDLGAVQSDLGTFFGDLERVLAEQTAEFRAALDAERANVERQEQELIAQEARTNRMLGEVAYDSVLEVRDRFGELSLRANLGIIDVAWREKEDLTDMIESLYDDQRQRLQVLEADFAEILDE